MKCSVCGGELQLLGQLGRVKHLRCRQCGGECSYEPADYYCEACGEDKQVFPITFRGQNGELKKHYDPFGWIEGWCIHCEHTALKRKGASEEEECTTSKDRKGVPAA
jgi:ribosomal protein L37E